jgi:hypothetical protein
MRPEPVEGHIPRGFDKLSPHDQPMCPEPVEGQIPRGPSYSSADNCGRVSTCCSGFDKVPKEGGLDRILGG